MTAATLGRVNTDYYAGLLMVLIGLLAAYQGLTYQVGTLERMGPGFFPVALGMLLALLGVGIALSAPSRPPQGNEEAVPPEWRGWICICLSIVAFIIVGRYGGLVPATFAIVFISALGDRSNTLLGAVILACALVVICVAVFWWGLQMQFPLFQWG